jgi:release factor glutamine methyltransferase
MISIKKLKQKYYKPRPTFPQKVGRRNKIDLLDLELIISRVIKKPREFVLAHPEHKVIANCELRIANYVKRRISGEPLAYIFGEKEFYGLNFKVNKNVLVPRPETELLVEEALYLASRNSQSATLIDVGTGSGCIIITLAKQLKNSKFFAIDISKPALKIAHQNAKLHKVNKQIKFLQSNLLESIIKKIKNKKLIIDNPEHSGLIIVSNLPYLTPTQIKNSPTIRSEPKLALIAGRDGLKYYRKLFNQIKNLQATSPEYSGLQAKISVLCEIDPSQNLKIKKIIKKNLPQVKIKIKKDLCGLNRLVIVTM